MKKNIVKKNVNIVKVGMIVPKLLNQETLNQIKNYKTIQYQFKFDEPVKLEIVKKKNLFMHSLLELKKHLIN